MWSKLSSTQSHNTDCDIQNLDLDNQSRLNKIEQLTISDNNSTVLKNMYVHLQNVTLIYLVHDSVTTCTRSKAGGIPSYKFK